MVVSPHAKRTLAVRVVSGEVDESATHTGDLRWLPANLGSDEGLVRYGSSSKIKGIEPDAVVVMNAGSSAASWANKHNLNLKDMLYVALSRITYLTVVARPMVSSDSPSRILLLG